MATRIQEAMRLAETALEYLRAAAACPPDDEHGVHTDRGNNVAWACIYLGSAQHELTQ